MIVLSSAKIKRPLRERLVRQYETVDFLFRRSMEEAKEDLPRANVLITYGEDLNEDLVAKANELKWVMVISAGVDEMPLSALKKKNIMVTNARGIHAIPMAEYTMAAMLAAVKNMRKWYENQKKHVWDRRVPMEELYGKTLAVIGTGAIGREIGRRARAFGMRVIGLNRSARHVEPFVEMYTKENADKCLAQADVIVSVLPATKETDNFFGRRQFEQMKKNAVFINIGRGNAVVEKDLVEVLKEEKIGHAILDVFSREPLEENHPFWEMENVTLTPHFSSITPQYQDRALEIFEHNLQLFMQGKTDALQNQIDFEKGY